MKVYITPLLLIALFFITASNCYSQKDDSFKPKVVYSSEVLVITQISKKSFLHTSFKQTNDFGKVPCNGLIVTDRKEAIVFDTPSDNPTTIELVKWITETSGYKINAVVATHFHDDSLGGLKAFHDKNIPSYAYFKTIDLAKENNFVAPQNSFTESIKLKVGKKNIVAKFFGQGHSKDNIVGYFPGENILFGGCLLKEIGAGKGYLGDANVADWSDTVDKIKKEFPYVKIVIPGHGEAGDKRLLTFTSELFR